MATTIKLAEVPSREAESRAAAGRVSDLVLSCPMCGRVTVLDGAQQVAILAELTKPAQRKIIECACGRYQFALAAQAIRQGTEAMK